MPAPDVVLKSYPGSALDQTLGCMTGLFHMFEGHPAFTSRRYSSTRLSIHSQGQGQLRAQAESQSHRHEPRNNLFSKVDDTHKKAVQHQRSHSDVTGDFAMAAAPSRTLPEFHTLKDGHVEPAPAYSEGTVDALAFYTNESLRAAALFAGNSRQRSDLDQRECSKQLPKARPVDSDMSSTDIRDAILASFQREVERPKSSDHSLNSSFSNQGRRDHGCQKDMKGVVSRKSVDLPRSPSVYARNSHEPSELVNWKEGLRSSASPPRKLSHHNSPERRVEPKKLDRGRSPAKDHYPFASMSPKRITGSQGTPNLQDRRHGEIVNQDHSFKESPGASDFRESLRPFLTHERDQNVPAERFEASRSGFDHSSSFSESNLVGVSNRDSAESYNEHSVVPNVIARLMGLEEMNPSSNQEAGIPSSDAKSRGGRFFRGLVQFDPQNMRPTSPPPPPPSQPKKLYVVHHLEQPSAYYRNEYRLEGAYQDNYPAQYKLEQELCNCKEDRDYEHLDSVPFLPFEDEVRQEEAHPASGQLEESTGWKLAEYPCSTHAENTTTVAPGKKKKMIRKILEAMRPKMLLKISQRKQEKSPVTKLITKEDSVQPVEEAHLEKQQQSTLIKVVTTGLKLHSETENREPPRCTTSDTSSVKQVLEEIQLQTDSGPNSESESSVVKPCILEPDANKIVVMKPKTKSHMSNAGNIFQVRHVETSLSTPSSTSTDIEMVPTRRTAAHLTKNIEENPNLAKDQRRAMKHVKPRAANSDNSPRRARAKISTLESDYESDPSSTTKSNDVREYSRKIRTPTGKRGTPSSKSPTPDIHRQINTHHGRYLSPDSARPSPRNSPIKDHCKVDRKSVVAEAKKSSRATPNTNPKTQLVKEETLNKKRVSEKQADGSRLCGSRALENVTPTLTNIEKPAAKEAFSIRSTATRARSPSALRKVDANTRSSTTDGSNSALLRPALSASLRETSGSELHKVLEPLVSERSKDPHVHNIRHTTPEEQKTIKGGDSVEDHHSGSTSDSTCSVIPNEAQPLLQVEESTTIEVSEEVTTPRGIPFHGCENLESKLDEGLDRPSPISVLDVNITFGEELTPSPSSPRHSFQILQDSETTYNDEGFETVCDRELEAPSALRLGEDDLDLDGLFSKCAERLRVQVESTITKNRLNKFQSYFKDHTELDEERSFVERFLLEPKVSCKFNRDTKTNPSHSLTENTETRFSAKLRESLESNGMLQETNRMLLLDCLEEIMERVMESSQLPASETMICTESGLINTRGQNLEQELWMEVRDIKLRTASPIPEDICDTVHRLLQRDFIRCQGRQWSTFTKEREQIGIDMEHMILQDLIEVAVSDLCALQWRNCPDSQLAPRRQLLFTN